MMVMGLSANAPACSMRAHASAQAFRKSPGLPLRRAPVLPFSISSRRRVIQRGVYASNPVSDVGKYLSEAAASIFSPTASDVDWQTSAFSGKIVHHEELPRLRKVYDVVKQTRESIVGCLDPNAANYDPKAIIDSGTCTYVDDSEKPMLSGDLRSYLTETLSKVFDSNPKVKGSSTEPDWNDHLGYSYRGQPVSQRDISRLLHYERTVKKVIDAAETEAKK